MEINLGSAYEECFPRVYSFARRMLGEEEAARDVAQETFAVAARKIGGYRGEGSLISWLLAIARNLCLEKRRRSRERSFGDIAAIVDRYAEQPSDAHSEIERRWYIEEVKEGCLLGLLQCLPFAQRCAFILRLLVGLEMDEMARALGKSVNSARILISRARAAMRAFLCDNCSLVEGAGRCTCESMIEFSLNRGLIQRYREGPGAPEIRDELRRFADEVELYKSLPDPAAEIARAIAGGKYEIFAKK